MKKNNSQWFGGIWKALFYTGLILVLMGIGVPSGFCQGAKWVKPEMVFPEHYPYGFHGMGEVGRVGERDIVIDDAHFELAPGVKFHTLDTKNASKAFFRPGMRVGYIISHEKVIESIWLIE
jgi:hypothetical protein